VVEKYISQGRKSAEQLSKESYRATSGARPLQELIDRMLRSQAEMLPLWLDLFGSLSRVDSFRPNYPAGPTAERENNGIRQDCAISIEMTCSRPVEVSIDFDHESTQVPLVTPGLYALDRHKPVLTGVSFVPQIGRKRGKLSIKVPDQQPAGSYSGVMVDPRSGETRGTLSVRIGDARSTAGRS
jgi:hypothetical protein